MRDAVTASYEYDPDASHTWITAVEKPTVKKEAGRLKGRQLLWTVDEHYKVDPKSAVLLEIKDQVKTKFHGDKLAESLATWDNVMIHIDASTVDTYLKGSISEPQMEKFVKMTECFKMYQWAPEGHGNRTYKFLFDSAKLIVNTERYKTNRDRRQTTEYDFVPDPSRKMKGAILTKMPRKDAREKPRSVRKPPSFPRRTNFIQIKRRCADSSSMANASREIVVNSDS